MGKELRLGTLAGLQVSAAPSMIFAWILLWGVLAALAGGVLRLPPVSAVLAGLAGVVCHYVAALVHQLGHAWAARRAGHPMRGVRLWGLLGTSLYPEDEGELPAAVHVRRALGGPAFSLSLTLLAAVLALLARPFSDLAAWALAYLALDSFLVFTLGALAPLGFTDGSTLLRWRR